MKYVWCEVWLEELGDPPYVLLLLKERTGDFVVYDPYEHRYPFRSRMEQDAVDWLCEDGFSRIDGGAISIPRTN